MPSTTTDKPHEGEGKLRAEEQGPSIPEEETSPNDSEDTPSYFTLWLDSQLLTEVCPYDMTAAEYIPIYEEMRRRWRQCDDRAQFRMMFGHHIEADLEIKRAISIGLGSFESRLPNEKEDVQGRKGVYDMQQRKRSLAQLAIFMDLVEFLEDRTGSKIDVLLADDSFKDRDFEVLELLNIPFHRHKSDWSNLIDVLQNTDIVFSPFTGADLEVMTRSPKGLPAVYIGLHPHYIKSHIRGRKDGGLDSTHEFSFGPADLYGKREVRIEKLPKTEEHYTLWSAFRMLDGLDELDLEYSPLQVGEMWVYRLLESKNSDEVVINRRREIPVHLVGEDSDD